MYHKIAWIWTLINAMFYSIFLFFVFCSGIYVRLKSPDDLWPVTLGIMTVGGVLSLLPWQLASALPDKKSRIAGRMRKYGARATLGVFFWLIAAFLIHLWFHPRMVPGIVASRYDSYVLEAFALTAYFIGLIYLYFGLIPFVVEKTLIAAHGDEALDDDLGGVSRHEW